ncbi:hypothetical protein OG592_27185 [Streptomyces avidinii]|uniref:hypothetical protein n=1 Tax=Streptomyces avidinii TaxID=1895 RepID=UPI0038638CBB|nr:hypothetical protein OG592_27185 [Streptomyces avidinii]
MKPVEELLNATPTDWHKAGCHRSCRFEHTNTPGGCAHAPASEPIQRLSVLRVRTLEDGHDAIVTQVYTLPELTDAISAALRTVGITLGPNSLRPIQDGHRMRLTDGEYDAMAMSAAAALIDGNMP